MSVIVRSALLSTAILLTLALAPVVADAAFVKIDDLTDFLSLTSDFGSFGITGETVTFSGVYTSADPSRPALGSVLTSNVNFIPDMAPPCAAEITPVPCLSDTLSVTLTGVDPGTAGGNVQVDVTFNSLPTARVSGSDIIEDGSYQGFPNLLTDLSVTARSDCLENQAICTQPGFVPTPEPASLWLLGVALAGLGLMTRRRKTV